MKLRTLAFSSVMLAALAAPITAEAARTVWRADSAGVRYELTADSLIAQPPQGPAVALTGHYRREADRRVKETLEFAHGVAVEYALQPLAVAGPYVSLAVDEYVSPYPALGPNIARRFATFRVGPGLTRLKLTGLFAEHDVVKALLADGVVKRHLKRGPAPTTLSALSARLEDPGSGAYTFSGDPAWVDSFAFHHVKGDRVAVHIALPGGNAVHRTQRTELGIYLPMPAAMRSLLSTAAREGRLMDRLKAGTAKVTKQQGQLPDGVAP
jgi:hypothetical protein